MSRYAAPTLALAAVALTVSGCGAGQDVAPTPQEAADAVAETPGTIRRPPLRAGQFSLRVDRPVTVRATPGGRALGRVSPRTRFGTRTALAVVAHRGAGLAVLSERSPNGRAGWVPAAGAVLQRQPYSLRIDRSARVLTVRRGAAQVRAMRVAVGAPATPTPLGRSAVTDTFTYPTGSGRYGCCAVALTSRQENLPPSWRGGAQIAIHGTADESVIGRAVSLGCVSARNADLRWLIRNIPAGALVTVVR